MTLLAAALLPLLEAVTAATALRDIARVPQDFLAPPRDTFVEWPSDSFTPGKEETELLSIDGAGVIRSIAMEYPAGTLRFYFDGAKTPQWEVPAVELLDPKRGIAPPELITRTALAGETILPITFAKGLRITAAENVPIRFSAAIDRVEEGETWWPFAPATPAGFDEAMRAATAPPPRGELLHEWEIDLTPDAREWTFTAPTDLAIGALEWECAGDGDSAERMRMRLPFAHEAVGAALFFGPVQDADPLNARIVETRDLGGVWHFPFAMKKGESITLQLRDGETDSVRGTLRVFAAQGEARRWISVTEEPQKRILRSDAWLAAGFASLSPGEAFEGVVSAEVFFNPKTPGLYRDRSFATQEDALPQRYGGVLAPSGGERVKIEGTTSAGRTFHEWILVVAEPLGMNVPRGSPLLIAQRESVKQLAPSKEGKWRAEESLQRRTGDQIALIYSASDSVLPESIRGTISWMPGRDGAEDLARFDDDVSRERGDDGALLFYLPQRFRPSEDAIGPPGDGVVRYFGDETVVFSANPPSHYMVLEVGDNASWPGGPAEVEVSLPENSPLRIESLWLLRHDAPTTAPAAIQPLLHTGGRQQWQWPRSEARFTAKQLFQGARGVGFQLAFWSQQWLENVEAWPLGFRVADEARRKDPLVGADVLIARAGEIELRHPSLKGATRIALRLGHGPRCGYVLVEDAARNVLGAENAFMNTRVVLPRIVEFALPAPNPDGSLTLRGAEAPGSHGNQIVVESLLVLERQAR